MYFAPSLVFFILSMLPKLYSYYLLLWIIFTRPTDDKRRKYTFKAFTFSEFRVQALNVDYIVYEKMKTECQMGSFKFFVEDIP